MQIYLTISVADSYHHSFTVTEYWDGQLYIYQHTFHKVWSVNPETQLPLDASQKLQRELKSPVYPELNSGAEVHLDIVGKQDGSIHSSIKNTPNTDQEQHANDYTHRTHDSTSDQEDPGGILFNDRDASSQTDTCSDKSCSDIPNAKSLPRTLKILTFNIWNTNVVHGGNKEYVSRIKQAAKVSVRSLGKLHLIISCLGYL